MIRLSLKEKSVIELIKSNESYANYFFGKYDKVRLFSVLKSEGFFYPEKNPKPREVKNGYQIPEWNVLQYLEKISHKTRSLDVELLKIIQEVSNYKDENGNHIDNYRTWWFFVKILLSIPLSKVPYELFDSAMSVWLTSMFDLTLPGADLTDDLLPKYLNQAKDSKDIKKVEKLIDHLLSIQEIKSKKSILGETFDVRTKIDDHWLQESLINKNNAALIAQICTNKPILNLANTIKLIFNKKYEKQDYSYIWLRDLSKEQNKSLHNGEYFLAVILRKLSLEKVKHSSIEGNELIKAFLSDDYPHYLFKRLALLLIAENWADSMGYFELILDNTIENFFEVDAFHPELMYLLIRNKDNLSRDQIAKIIRIIDNGPSRELPDKRKEEYKLYWKQSWYKDLDVIPKFKKLYDYIKKQTGKEITKSKYDEDYWVFREIPFDKSPISAQDFLSKTNEDIVKFISEYKPTGEFTNASPEGLYRTFQAAIELDPVKFTKNLTPLRINNYHMLCSLYTGLEEAWKQKKDILWPNVIKFTLNLLKEDWFWNPPKRKTNGHYDYFTWTLSAISDLIQEGCKSDGWAFPEELISNVEEIIKLLVNHLTYEKDSYQGDGITHALNSSPGKTLTALIYLGLREARLSDKKLEKKVSKWSDSLKKDYEKALKENIYEAYTLLGQYCPNLHYIDSKWTESKIQNIHLIENVKFFETFMEGYLFTGNIYDKIYLLLRDSYKKALSIKFEEKRIEERLIQHISVGYLRGREELGKNSLMDKLISLNNPDYIREVVEFLWHQRDYILDEKSINKKTEEEKKSFKGRIFMFWDYILNIINKKRTLVDEDKKVLSELSKFATYLSVIDKNAFNKLEYSAPFVTYDFDSPYFIEYLNDLKDKGNINDSAKYVGRLFLTMLKGAENLIPDYKWENIEEIVIYLYEIGKSNTEVKDLANQICIFYAEHRNLNLRKLYEENNAIPA